MVRLCWALLLLAAALSLALRTSHAWDSKKVVRPFQDIPENYVYVQQALWFAMKEYNKASRDMYNFRVVEVMRTQEQVTDSLEYYIDVNIARTMCKKISGENKDCLFQEDPKMKKMVFCTFIVASKPWKLELTMLKKECRDI
ncbi:cystatin-13-like [Carlito syrichta]|uniref:Cystatin-13-like n=1 Tax=Carlito syrichta TaxID=1868482 RepID=A0A1U7TX12_CARSF|nr:cystatin-13-like [Carlito syrichta]